MFSVKTLLYSMRMNWKISRNEKDKYFNEEKLALGENENITAPMNIAQEDDSNIFELLQNLWLSNIQFIIWKCSRFCLFIIFVTFVFILLVLYTQMFVILYFSRLEKERKKQFKTQPSPVYLNFHFFPTTNSSLLFHTPRLSEVWEYSIIH